MAIELTTANENTLADLRSALQVTTFKEVFPEGKFSFNAGAAGLVITGPDFGTVANFSGLCECKRIDMFGGHNISNEGLGALSAINHVSCLSSLEDLGTAYALRISGNQFTSSTLNTIFTELPVTTKTATIDVRYNPGAATCDTSIATNKGYTVLAS